MPRRDHTKKTQDTERPCPSCDGDGYITDKGKEVDCKDCRGTGKKRRSN